MALMNYFCCKYSTKCGAVFSGFCVMFSAVMSLGLELIQYSGYTVASTETYPELSLLCYGSLGAYSLLVLFAFALMATAQADKKCFCLPWVLYLAMIVILEVVSTFRTTQIDFYINKGLKRWDIFYIVFASMRAVMNIYCILAVVSHYQVLRNASTWDTEGEEECSQKNLMAYLGGNGISSVCVMKTTDGDTGKSFPTSGDEIAFRHDRPILSDDGVEYLKHLLCTKDDCDKQEYLFYFVHKHNTVDATSPEENTDGVMHPTNKYMDV